MPNLPLKSANVAVACKVSTARRAVWLFLGWLAFWLGAVVYPCQAHHAPLVKPGAAAAVSMNAGMHPDSSPLDSSPAHDDGTCQELTAPSIGGSVVMANAGTLNPDPPAPIAFDTQRLAPAVHAFNAYAASHPPPHTPLFLSTQRLLI